MVKRITLNLKRKEERKREGWSNKDKKNGKRKERWNTKRRMEEERVDSIEEGGRFQSGYIGIYLYYPPCPDI